MFPVAAEHCEREDNRQAQAEYRALGDGFKPAITRIPEAHRASLPLWLDHFDSLWQTYTHAIPSATAGNVKPEVSLYDHSRTTAALADAGTFNLSNAMTSVGQSAAGVMIANQNSGLGALVQQAVTVQANLAVGR